MNPENVMIMKNLSLLHRRLGSCLRWNHWAAQARTCQSCRFRPGLWHSPATRPKFFFANPNYSTTWWTRINSLQVGVIWHRGSGHRWRTMAMCCFLTQMLKALISMGCHFLPQQSSTRTINTMLCYMDAVWQQVGRLLDGCYRACAKWYLHIRTRNQPSLLMMLVPNQ